MDGDAEVGGCCLQRPAHVALGPEPEGASREEPGGERLVDEPSAAEPRTELGRLVQEGRGSRIWSTSGCGYLSPSRLLGRSIEGIRENWPAPGAWMRCRSRQCRLGGSTKSSVSGVPLVKRPGARARPSTRR
jgi:hypothetical protein